MLAAELAQKCCHPPLTPQLTTGKKQQQRSFQQEMDSAVQVCHFSWSKICPKIFDGEEYQACFGHKDILSSADIFSLKSDTFDPRCLEVRNSVDLALRHMKKGPAAGLEELQSSRGRKASQHNLRSLFIKI